LTQPKPHYQFRLQTLLIAVTVLAVALGWVRWEVEQIRKERAVVAWVGDADGSVSYPKEYAFFSRDQWFGVRVKSVDLENAQLSDLSPLAELQNLTTLCLNGSDASDLSSLSDLKNIEGLAVSYTRVSDLSPLAELTNLEQILIWNSQVSDEQVQELKRRLPKCVIPEQRP
jgi:hypothetical protein